MVVLGQLAASFINCMGKAVQNIGKERAKVGTMDLRVGWMLLVLKEHG